MMIDSPALKISKEVLVACVLMVRKARNFENLLVLNLYELDVYTKKPPMFLTVSSVVKTFGMAPSGLAGAREV